MLLCIAGADPTPDMQRVDTADRLGQRIEIRGVAAGDFAATHWREAALHMLPDMRHPILEPSLGKFRNIYAPSAVELPTGWRLFYGAFDGTDTPNDCIYYLDTPDFLQMGDHHTVIDHGDFVHVCNVNAFRNADGSYEMMCTAYPDQGGNNKPAYFTSPDGIHWNGSPMPHHATSEDLISIEGYDGFEQADINGMNVLLREEGARRIYFNDFRNMGAVFRASGADGRKFIFEGEVLDCPYVVNDIKVFHDEETNWYLMGLHMNREGLWYSLSPDGRTFEPAQPLLTHRDEADRYIVAIGWVRRDNRLLGVLYGAGAVPTLDANRIFARWLQCRVVFETLDGTCYEATHALGPDRQVIDLPVDGPLAGRFFLYAEDGVTELGRPIPAQIASGEVWALQYK